MGDNWFTVDRKGLAATVARRGKSFILAELLQNAFDERVHEVTVTLTRISGLRCELSVADDAPEGFRQLSEAWTLFAESYKKADPTKRGRFDIGEKLCLALADKARITSTTGTVYFMPEGRSHTGTKREVGTEVWLSLKLATKEFEDMRALARRILIPPGVVVRFNGLPLDPRPVLREIGATLQTEIADAEGILRRSNRKTTVRVVEARDDEVAMIYEMGIPVVETSDRYHLDVGQKVPLTLERDNVPPAYLRALRTIALNAMADALTADDATDPWVREAAGSKDADPDAVRRVMDLRFGERRVAYDPSDREANSLATAAGYTVVTGGALSRGEWSNVRASEAMLPAGRVTPSPKAYAEDGDPMHVIPPEKWTTGMTVFATYAKRLHRELVGSPLTVVFVRERDWGFQATYGRRLVGVVLTVNAVGGLAFRPKPTVMERERWLSLLIHEFGHHHESNHLSERYHRALCDLAAKLATLALEQPTLVRGTEDADGISHS